MANVTLILCFLLTSISFGQTKGIYTNHNIKTKIEILDSNKIAIYGNSLGQKDTVMLDYLFKEDSLFLSYTCYTFNCSRIKKKNSTENNYEIELESNEAICSNPIFINEVRYTCFGNRLAINNKDTIVNIKIEMPFCLFNETFVLNTSEDYLLNISFTYQNYDEKGLSIIYLKRRKLIVKGKKYKLQKD